MKNNNKQHKPIYRPNNVPTYQQNLIIPYQTSPAPKTITKEIIVKNQINELGAKVSLESYLKRKYGEKFIRLEVKSCEQNIMEKWGEMFGFGGRSPFGF